MKSIESGGMDDENQWMEMLEVNFDEVVLEIRLRIEAFRAQNKLFMSKAEIFIHQILCA